MKFPIERIIARKDLNPRLLYGNIEGLANDIKLHGQREPVKVGFCNENKMFYLFDGFRRLECAKLNNEEYLDCGNSSVITYESIPSDKEIRDKIYFYALRTEQSKN